MCLLNYYKYYFYFIYLKGALKILQLLFINTSGHMNISFAQS